MDQRPKTGLDLNWAMVPFFLVCLARGIVERQILVTLGVMVIGVAFGLSWNWREARKWDKAHKPDHHHHGHQHQR